MPSLSSEDFSGLATPLQVLASLLDMVYRSDEKEKAVPLVSRLLYYVFPYLRNHRCRARCPPSVQDGRLWGCSPWLLGSL